MNPHRETVLGLRAYPSVRTIPGPIDLAVIAIPAASVPAVVRECADCGVGGAIIVSAGFRETGPAGRDLEEQVLEAARYGHLRLVGPNSLGVMCPATGLNATFAPAMARKGSVSLISQSGAICTALLDWSLREQVGFSALLSVGSMLDVGWGALIDYLSSDPQTKSIVIYMESVGDARSFLSAAREVAFEKPILVLKAGRTGGAAQAVASHTGALAGSDAVLDAAFRRIGILRLENVGDIFQMTEVLARQPRPAGPRLSIVTNAGGPGILATDALLGLGDELAPLAPETIEALNRVLPPHWSHRNPIDLIGDAGPDRYEQALQIATQDPCTDGLLVILTPQAMTDPTETARRISPFASIPRKPILANWMGGLEVAEGEALLNQAGIPTFSFPDEAVRVFHSLWRYSYDLRALYETPESTTRDPSAADHAATLISQVQQGGRTLLTEFESKQLLANYGIPTTETRVARTEDEAVEAARAIGFPIVVKLHSYTLTHKTDVGGVKLSLPNAEAVRTAFREVQAAVTEKMGPQHFAGVTVQPMIARESYELIVGATTDPQFGPVLLFGAGGQLVEVLEDRALALPPLNTTLARRFLEQTKIFKALEGIRGRSPVNLSALEGLLVRFSELVLEQAAIREIEINPLLASPEGLLALDARVVIYEQGVDLAQVPRPAIRPYPRQYATELMLIDGTRLHIRPIRPEDEAALARFHATLSEASVFKRYFSLLPLETRTRHERLMRTCSIDYDRQMALIAERPIDRLSQREIVGVGRLIKSPWQNEAEIAVTVCDSWQRRGIGRALVRRLKQFAGEEKIQILKASVLVENWAMQKLLEAEGFTFRNSSMPEVWEGQLSLDPP